MSAQELMEEAGPYLRAVSVDQPAPGDMPFRLEVLGLLAEGVETIYTMRNCGDMKPYGLALVGENVLLSMLRDLVDEGLVEAESEYVIVDDQLIEREPHLPLATSDDDWAGPGFAETGFGGLEGVVVLVSLSGQHRRSETTPTGVVVGVGG